MQYLTRKKLKDLKAPYVKNSDFQEFQDLEKIIDEFPLLPTTSRTYRYKPNFLSRGFDATEE